MNPTCKKRLGAISLETMKVVAQEESRQQSLN